MCRTSCARHLCFEFAWHGFCRSSTMVMLELEAMHLDRVKTDLSGHYVDHNLIQADYKNPDDHLFLCSAAQRFGLRFSRPGNGVSHPLHQEPFGKPGATLPRFRQPHAGCWWHRHACHRGRWHRSGDGDGRPPKRGCRPNRGSP